MVLARIVSARFRAYAIERRRLLHLAMAAAPFIVPMMIAPIPAGWPEWLFGFASVGLFPLLLYATGFLRMGERAYLHNAIARLWGRAVILID
jgi:hypothetical protein